MYKGETNGKVRGTGIEDRTSDGSLSKEQIQGLLNSLSNCPPGEFGNRCNVVHEIFRDHNVRMPSIVYEKY